MCQKQLQKKAELQKEFTSIVRGVEAKLIV